MWALHLVFHIEPLIQLKLEKLKAFNMKINYNNTIIYDTYDIILIAGN